MKTVLITGAGSGIGLATTRKFLDSGYNVFAHCRDSKQSLEELGSKCLAVHSADFSDLSAVTKTFEAAVAKFGRVDVLINNAAIYHNAESILRISEESYLEHMKINAQVPFILSQLALKHMKPRKWGRIINISSIGLKFGGDPGTAAYTISKAALEAMTVSFAKEAALSNILVNAVRVGVTDTNFHLKNPGKDLVKRAQMIPLGRMAVASEIAATILFLASEDSSFTTGSVISVSGGE